MDRDAKRNGEGETGEVFLFEDPMSRLYKQQHEEEMRKKKAVMRPDDDEEELLEGGRDAQTNPQV